MRVIIRHNILLPSGDLRFVACNVGLVTSLLSDVKDLLERMQVQRKWPG